MVQLIAVARGDRDSGRDGKAGTVKGDGDSSGNGKAGTAPRGWNSKLECYGFIVGGLSMKGR